MAGLKEFYCRSNETSLGSQFKWLEYTFNNGVFKPDTNFLLKPYQNPYPVPGSSLKIVGTMYK
jgi:hypothetical protein